MPQGSAALAAVMRKLPITANAVARARQPWRGAATAMPVVGASCRAHDEPPAHRAGRVKAKAALAAVARSDSLESG